MRPPIRNGSWLSAIARATADALPAAMRSSEESRGSFPSIFIFPAVRRRPSGSCGDFSPCSIARPQAMLPVEGQGTTSVVPGRPDRRICSSRCRPRRDAARDRLRAGRRERSGFVRSRPGHSGRRVAATDLPGVGRGDRADEAPLCRGDERANPRRFAPAVAVRARARSRHACDMSAGCSLRMRVVCAPAAAGRPGGHELASRRACGRPDRVAGADERGDRGLRLKRPCRGRRLSALTAKQLGSARSAIGRHALVRTHRAEVMVPGCREWRARVLPVLALVKTSSNCVPDLRKSTFQTAPAYQISFRCSWILL
jgi:hypothetical protein